MLANKGINANFAKVYRYMKLLNLYSNIRIKKFVKKPKEHKNTVNRKWNNYQQDELWVTDVSYIPCNKNFVYLSSFKRCCYWAYSWDCVSKVNDNKIYNNTLKNAQPFNNKLK